jgi:4-amino-4-deoxy-L-arabinose transferase-like glycosyltransferase
MKLNARAGIPTPRSLPETGDPNDRAAPDVRPRPARDPALLLGVIAILLALSFADQLLLTAQPDSPRLGIFLCLPLLGLAAGAILAYGPAARIGFAAWRAPPAPRPLPRLSYPLMAGALLCAGYASLEVHNYGSLSRATVAWTCAIVLSIAAVVWPGRALNLRHPLLRLRDAVVRRAYPLAALAAILCVAAALRFIALDTVPGFIHPDEADVGLSARAVATGQAQPLLSYGFMGLPMLGYAWDGAFLRLFDESLAVLRASSAVLGVGSILITALLGKELFNWRAGLLAAAFLSFFHLHIHFSRDGLHNMQALFMVTATVYLLVLMLRYGSRFAAVATGITLSVDLQVFFSARLAFVMVALIGCCVLLVTDRQLWRSRLPALAWAGAAFVAAVAPLAALIGQDWQGFNQHTGDSLVTTTDPAGRLHMFSVYGTYDIWSVMRTNLVRAVQTFNFPGHVAQQYPLFPHPMLDPVSGALFAGAVAFALFRIRHTGFAICLIMFGVIMFFIGMLTLDQPDWNRLLIILPVIALLLGAFLDGIGQLAEQVAFLAKPAAVCVAALLIAVAFGNLRWYFFQFQPTIQQSISALAMDVANYLRAATNHPYAYTVDGGGFNIDNQAVRFVAPNVPACILPPNLDRSACPAVPARVRLFFIMPTQVTLIHQLRTAFPGGTVSVFRRYSDGQTVKLYRVGSP